MTLPLRCGGRGVELLDELAGVHAMLAERRADRRRGGRGAAGGLKLELNRNFFLGLSHVFLDSANPRDKPRGQ